METCLFTGETLTPKTKVEHTIPESLGGRIKSQVVTSDTFNNLCGTRIDFALKLAYEPMLNRLAPLLPKASQPGLMPIDMPGEEPGLAMEKGAVTRPKLLIAERDEGGRPKAVVASDEEVVKKFAQSQKKKPEEIRLSTVPAAKATMFERKVPVISREAEISALKCALLTFDHLLHGSPDRFTRAPELQQVRDFIRDAVEKVPDGKVLGELSFGLQYEKRGLYDRLRDQVPVARTEFEHVLFVSTQGGGKSLHIVWLVFGFDPFGFQLCSWPGAPFTYAVINPILRDESSSGPHKLPDPGEPLCLRTARCTMPWNMKPGDDLQPVFDEVSRERHAASGRAVKLVEMTADRQLIRFSKEAAELAKAEEKTVRRQVRARLLLMYGRKKDDGAFLDAVDAIMARHESTVANELLARAMTDLGEETGEWGSVLAYYRRCLADLETSYGLPGDWFAESSGHVVDPADQRRLGQLPPMDN